MTTMYRRNRQRTPWHDTIQTDDNVRPTMRPDDKWSPAEMLLRHANENETLQVTA